ncbi:MAG: site-specific DNA-methyltransferase [Bacteroidales bacterium]|nr:site-specific DNA-methyltransferase [Bacteroidales bacterium]
MPEKNNLEELKRDLVLEIKKRVTDKIIEKSNADLLEKLINQAETETEAMNIAALGTTYKRTGFHFDKRMECISNNIKYKKKNKKLSFVNNASHPTHQLIIGDNYEALQNLLITHKGKIDVIYIDPPYGKDNMGDFASTNYDNSITRDNLLSMLYPRLLMAKRLLTPEGVIFCSIDDRNQAYVKCLFDEVFGEENFVANFKWNKVKKAPSLSAKIRIKYEYVLAYGMPSKLFGKGSYNTQGPLWHKPNKAKKLFFPAKSIRIRKSFDVGNYGGTYEVILHNKIEFDNGVNKNDIYITACSAWGQDKINEYIKQGNSFEIKKSPTTIYVDSDPNGKFIAPSDLINDEECSVKTNTDANDELEKLKIKFDYSKPTSLLKYLVRMTTMNDIDAIILDFFAGSGTTGQAVMELNKEDGGNRTFILCTNNEVTETNPKGIAYDVTAKRLKRVMSGKCYDGTTDFPWLKNHEPYKDNLNVYEIAEVSKIENKKGKTAFDKIDETCYGQTKFEKRTDKIAWICSNFENATKFIEKKEGE